MGKSKIEWCDSVWNPVTGCGDEIISHGCKNCYARRMAHRLAGRYGYHKNNPFQVTLRPERLDEPFKWKKPKRIFVCSMGDLFHSSVPQAFTLGVRDIMIRAENHIFLVLTKRINRAVEFWGDKKPIKNIWIGVTVCNQQEADEKIPLLLQIPAAVRWVSIEPCLSNIRLDPRWFSRIVHGYPPGYQKGIDWVVLGGETGPGARPMKEEWATSVVSQCKSAGVPVFAKQIHIDDLIGKKWKMRVSKNMDEWPSQLKVRELPNAKY